MPLLLLQLSTTTEFCYEVFRKIQLVNKCILDSSKVCTCVCECAFHMYAYMAFFSSQLMCLVYANVCDSVFRCVHINSIHIHYIL